MQHDEADVSGVPTSMATSPATPTAVTERHPTLLSGVRTGLGQLRGLGSTTALLARAAEEAAHTCGFSRVILSRRVEDRFVPVSVYFVDDPSGASALQSALDADRPHLTHPLPEAEVIRCRKAVLVTDVSSDPRVHPAFATAWGAAAYVVAPITPDGPVVGFLHADRQGRSVTLDESDRDALWTFAEGFSLALAKAVLGERLRTQREQVGDVLSSTEQLTDELLPVELLLRLDTDTEPESAVGHLTLPGRRRPSRLEQLLTAREIDVIRLLAAGETNAGAANRLGITEGTVKSHVKHILRKLRAANRAEAVSRYLRLTAQDREP